MNPKHPELRRAPQRPLTRAKDIFLIGSPLDRANPKHPAGTDPRNVDALMRMETDLAWRRAS